jgi:hypothetical protein
MSRVLGAWRRIPPPVWALVAALVIIGAVGSRWMASWLTRDGGVRVSTPVPPARFGLTTITVAPGRRACVLNVTIPAGGEVAGLGGSVPTNKPGPPLTATLTAPGYLARSAVRRGWPEGLAFRFRPPAHDVVGRFCLRNEGRVPFVLNANNEPGVGLRSTSTLDGKPTPTVASLEFRKIAPATRLSRLGTMIDRAVAFSWGPLAGWSGRLLALLVLLLVPIGGVGAVLWAMEADRRAEDRPEPDPERQDREPEPDIAYPEAL